ncbi:hypothetical protein H4R35_005407, partial [Dimargaris xerosporica]
MDQAVYEAIAQTLSADANVRVQAELTLRRLENDSQFPVSLTQCALAPECALPQRQAAVFALKHYVDKHWSRQSQRFEEPELPAEPKAYIRSRIVQGLADGESKIRVGVAYVISEIAQYDWPEDWPELFDYLLHWLKTGTPEQVQATMCVYAEFVRRDMTEKQLDQIAALLPELYRIVKQESVYGPETRARAVAVFRDCLEVLVLVSYDQPTVADRHVKPILPQWEQQFAHCFPQPTVYQAVPLGPAYNLALKVEMLKAIKTILRFLPKDSPLLTNALEWVIKDLDTLQAPFIQGYVQSADAQTWSIPQGEAEYRNFGLDTYLFACFDFMCETLTRAAVRPYLVTGHGAAVEPTAFLANLLALIIPFMQISQEQMEVWNDDIDQFIADEEDESLNFSVRIYAQDVVKTLLDKYPTATVTALGQIAPRFESQAAQAREQALSHWWMILEACLIAIGLAAEDITETYKTSANRLAFDLPGLFEHVVFEMARCHQPFARGRALVFTGQFCEVLPQNVTQPFVETASAALANTSEALPVQISALRALSHFCRQCPHDQIAPYQAAIVAGIVRLRDHLTLDTLLVALETLHTALGISAEVTAQLEAEVGPFILGVWQQYPAEPLISSLVVDVLSELASNPHCYHQFQARVIPILSQVLNAPETDGGIIASALDLLAGLIRSGPTPLPAGYVETIFPELVALLQRNDDHAILQNGQECFTWLVAKDLDHLVRWHDSANRSGLFILLEFAAYMLQPQQSESSALFVGDLLTKLIQKGYSHIAPMAANLTNTIVTKLATAKTASFIQSLVLVIAHLILADPATAVTNLTQTTVHGQNGLTIVVQHWCEEYECFNGVYALKASAVAMSKLYRQAEPQLSQMAIKGDLIVNQAD